MSQSYAYYMASLQGIYFKIIIFFLMHCETSTRVYLMHLIKQVNQTGAENDNWPSTSVSFKFL